MGKPAMSKVTWTPEADTRLFLTILSTQNITVDYPKVAAAFGTTPASIIQRMFKLRQKAKELEAGAVANTKNEVKTENGIGSGVDATTPVKKRGRPAKNAKKPKNPKNLRITPPVAEVDVELVEKGKEVAGIINGYDEADLAQEILTPRTIKVNLPYEQWLLTTPTPPLNSNSNSRSLTVLPRDTLLPETPMHEIHMTDLAPITPESERKGKGFVARPVALDKKPVQTGRVEKKKNSKKTTKKRASARNANKKVAYGALNDPLGSMKEEPELEKSTLTSLPKISLGEEIDEVSLDSDGEFTL